MKYYDDLYRACPPYMFYRLTPHRSWKSCTFISISGLFLNCNKLSKILRAGINRKKVWKIKKRQKKDEVRWRERWRQERMRLPCQGWGWRLRWRQTTGWWWVAGTLRRWYRTSPTWSHGMWSQPAHWWTPASPVNTRTHQCDHILLDLLGENEFIQCVITDPTVHLLNLWSQWTSNK